MNTHRLHGNQQSTYCTGHSTGTVLLNVHHDITESLDNKSMVALVLLDLSTAFDVINHGIIQKWLEYSFGGVEVPHPEFSPISVTESSVLQKEQEHQKVCA